MKSLKRLLISWLKKKLRIASPTWYQVYGYIYEYDYLISKREVEQLKYIRSVVDNTYRNEHNVYYMTDSEAMEALRNHFKREV